MGKLNGLVESHLNEEMQRQERNYTQMRDISKKGTTWITKPTGWKLDAKWEGDRCVECVTSPIT